jgi:hypothetical protein
MTKHLPPHFELTAADYNWYQIFAVEMIGLRLQKRRTPTCASPAFDSRDAFE